MRFLRKWTHSYFSRETEFFDINAPINVSGDFDLVGIIKNLAFVEG